MPVVSITLPSLYPAALERSLNNIEDATRCEYQVIVVSPFQVKRAMRGGELVWVEETKSTGCNAAHMAALAYATGEFITGWVDDHFYSDGWDVLARRDFLEREALFHANHPGAIFELGLRHRNPTHVGTEFGIYYPYFPFMRTSDARQIGWLTDEYRTGFADSDLAMRVWDCGGRCEWSRDGLIIVHADDQRKNMSHADLPIDDNVDVIDQAHCRPDDMALFIRRWAPKYGQGWDLSHLRGFNTDVTPEKFPQFIDETGRSIYHNKPEFKATVGEGG